MENKKSKIIILIILTVILVGIALLFIFSDGGVYDKITNKNQTSTTTPYVKAERTSNFSRYFSIAQIVDSLYEAISYGETDKIITKYSNEYLNSKSLNKSNIISTLNPELNTSYKYVTDLFISCNINNCYYFVELEGLVIEEANEISRKLDKEYLMIVVDLATKGYKITPLSNVNNFEEYSLNYPCTDVKIEATSDNEYALMNNDHEYIIRYYLNYISYIIALDITRIDTYMTNYFPEKRYVYLQKLGNTLLNYGVDEVEKGYSYKGLLYDGTSFNIVSEEPMNFKITIH